MKKYHVFLTYLSLKTPQRVVIDAESADLARALAHVKYPNATINGPSSVIEVKHQ